MYSVETYKTTLNNYMIKLNDYLGATFVEMNVNIADNFTVLSIIMKAKFQT